MTTSEALTLDQRAAALERFPIMKGVPAPQLRALAEQMREVRFDEGAEMVTSGKEIDGVYFTLSGWIDVRIAGVSIAHHGPGEPAADLAAFTSTALPGTAVAAAPLVGLMLTVEEFRAAAERTPKLAQNLLRLYGARLRIINVLRFLHFTEAAPAQAVPVEGDRADVLRALPLFSGVADEAFFRRLAANVKELSFAPGDEIVHRGAPNDAMILVAAGEVEARLDEMVLGTVAAGHTFGELGLLDGEPHAASFFAVTPVRALTIGRAQLFAAANQSPKMVLNLIGVLAWRVRLAVIEVARRMAASGDDAPPAGADERQAKRAPYLDIPQEAWVKDPHFRWRMPLSGDLTRQFAELTAVVSAADPTQHAPDADDFKRALEEERKAFEGALRGHGCADAIVALSDSLYGCLRSTVHPKKGYSAVAAAIAAASSQRSPVRLRAVLASPTAVSEVPSFLRAASLFREHGLAVDLRALLVRWENLVDVEGTTEEARAAAFSEIVAQVRAAFAAAGFEPTGVEPVDVEVALSEGSVKSPAPVAAIFEAIRGAGGDLSRADPALGRDLIWITGFYERQASLSRLGPRQPPLDLALRRYIGGRFGAEARALEAEGSPSPFMLTSELHKRFLGCYAASLPMLNIQLA